MWSAGASNSESFLAADGQLLFVVVAVVAVVLVVVVVFLLFLSLVVGCQPLLCQSRLSTIDS